ncbi:MAG: hypothetical protein AAF402_00800 [Pseudomonadota bacterium]
MKTGSAVIALFLFLSWTAAFSSAPQALVPIIAVVLFCEDESLEGEWLGEGMTLEGEKWPASIVFNCSATARVSDNNFLPRQYINYRWSREGDQIRLNRDTTEFSGIIEGDIVGDTTMELEYSNTFGFSGTILLEKVN